MKNAFAFVFASVSAIAFSLAIYGLVGGLLGIYTHPYYLPVVTCYVIAAITGIVALHLAPHGRFLVIPFVLIALLSLLGGIVGPRYKLIYAAVMLAGSVGVWLTTARDAIPAPETRKQSSATSGPLALRPFELSYGSSLTMSNNSNERRLTAAVDAETPEAKAFQILTGKTLAEAEAEHKSGEAASKDAIEPSASDRIPTFFMTPDTNGHKLGQNWLWFLPLCVLVLLLVERHTLLYAWQVLKLGYARWRWVALLSPSADFCISAILFSVWWPFWGLAAVYRVFTTENINTLGKRYLYAFLIAVAIFFLLPLVSDAMIWGSFPFADGRLRMIPFIPWPSGGFGEY